MKHRVMFLGGSLDHATRMVEHEVNGMPSEDLVLVQRSPRAPWVLDHIVPDSPEERYQRHRLKSGSATWWTYILIGFTPSPTDLIDARPPI